MNCPSCNHENRSGAKFCEECATRLTPVCASCGAELRTSAKFCDECGTPVAGVAAAPRSADASGARKIVTILFADLVGSTALHERLDPESARRFMESYYAAARSAVEGHGGVVTQLLGDGVKAVFGIPRVAEDDALRAVHAAVAMQQSFRRLAEQQRGAVGQTGLRVAVNTGEVVAKDETEIIGDPVNVAARLQEQGGDGEVVIGESTHRLVESQVTVELLGSFSLKGRAEAVQAYRVESLEPPRRAKVVAFVGREQELARIGAVYDEAVATPAARMTVLLGSPGLGKSRLIDEFTRHGGRSATIVAAHCDAAGGTTFEPIADALREVLDLDAGAAEETVGNAVAAALPDSEERSRIAGGIGALLSGAPAAPEETFFVVRRLLAGLAAARPVVLVIDDLQWAEPLLLDLVEHLVQWGRGVPLLVLIGGRPELRDVRSSLATPGPLVADVVTLNGLDAGVAMQLAANAIGASDLPAAVAAKVLATSEGNPLFVGELVRMLVHEGALVRDGERWAAGTALDSLEMPPTIHALLAARIEQLDPQLCAVLERAAVVGRHFSRGAVAELLPPGANNLDAQLEALQRAELIERDAGWLFGEPALRFHHVLIRDAAYRRLLKGTRAELHERLANWIEARWGETTEHDETLGRHLEQAHQLLGELGPLDEHGAQLGARAAARLSAAGRRALAGDDLALAASLLGRAMLRLSRDDPNRAELALDWSEALLSEGNVAEAATAMAELERFAAGSERLQAWHDCFSGQLAVLSAPESLQDTVERVAAATRALAQLGDHSGEAKGHYVRALALARLGQVGACEAALDQALAGARRAGDRRRANTVLAIAPLAALWGPSPVTRASGRCLDVVRVLRITQGAPAVEAVALSCQGVLEALRGRTDAARHMLAAAREMVEELGITQRVLAVDALIGQVALLEGDAEAAEQSLRPAYEGLKDLGLGIDAARAAALLARAVLAQDRVDDAEAISRDSEALAGDDLKAAIAWRGVRAETLARSGRAGEAVELARRAVDIAAATDALLDHADALRALAIALRAGGLRAEADIEGQRANRIWDKKGASLLTSRPPAPGDQESLARARVDALTETERPQSHFANRATRWLEEALIRTWQARDWEGHVASFSPDLVFDDRRRPNRTQCGLEELLAGTRLQWEQPASAFELELLATRGERLAMSRLQYTAHSEGGDPLALPGGLVVYQVDSTHRAIRFTIFDTENETEALAYLEMLDGEKLGTNDAVRLINQRDWKALAAICSDDFVQYDHRSMALLGTTRGADAWVQNFRTLAELSPDVGYRVDHQRGSSHGFYTHGRWCGTREGGSFEIPTTVVAEIAPDGRFRRLDIYDGDSEDWFARFSELVDSTDAETYFTNAAWRAWREGFGRAWVERDAEGFAAVHHPSLRFRDQRKLFQLDLDREEFLEYSRPMLETAIEESSQLLATREDRLAVVRITTVFAAETAGPSEIDSLCLVEVDANGLIVSYDRYDVDDQDAAYVELDLRWQTQIGEPATRAVRFVEMLNQRQWEGLRSAVAPTFQAEDHRTLGWGSVLRAIDKFIEAQQALYELSPDASYRVHHQRTVGDVTLQLTSQHGSRAGGYFENRLLCVTPSDSQGRVLSLNVYDIEQFREALAQFEELSRATPAVTDRFPNAATRQFDDLLGADGKLDFEAYSAQFAASFRYVDHRALAQVESNREEYLEAARQMAEITNQIPSREVLATRGDRWALMRILWRGDGGDVGPSELEWLSVIGVDADGRRTAQISFDVSDLEAAYAELDRRFAEDAEGEADALLVNTMQSMVDSIHRRDWAAYQALHVPDVIGRDHRLVSWGTLRGTEFTKSVRTMTEMAPDVTMRANHVRLAERASLFDACWLGTRDGGSFESPFISVARSNARGLIIEMDFFDTHHLDRAKALFEELAAAKTDDATARVAKPNVAFDAMQKWIDTFNARDWDAMREASPPTGSWEDRRHFVQLAGGTDFVIESAKARAESGAFASQKLIATAGERIAICHLTLAGGPSDGRFEIDALNVVEADESGRNVRTISLDLDDQRRGFDEAWARWAEIEPEVAGVLDSAKRMTDAINADDIDREAILASYAGADLVVEDHRRTGMGRIEGADTYVDSLLALRELTDRTLLELGAFWPAINRHGGVATVRRYGEISGGGSYESDYLAVILRPGKRITHVELFESEHLDEALARFEELCATADRPARP